MAGENAPTPLTLIGESGDAARDAKTGTLARGLAIVDVLLNAQQPLTLVEVATAAGLDQSTALRLLRTLEECNYVVRNAESKRYSPSPKALRPLPLLHPLEQMRREADAAIHELAERTNKTVVLTIFIGLERLVLDIAQTKNSITPYYGTWLHGPLHGSGAGKALLMSLDPARRAAAMGPEPYEAVTAQTHTTLAALEADLALSEQRGYAVARDEFHPGLTAVASLIKTWNGSAIGCLVATGYTRDLDDAALAATGEEVRRAAGLLMYQAPSLVAAGQFCGR